MKNDDFSSPALAKAGANDEKTLKLQVEGMTCHSCELLVERSWKGLPGVKSVKADSSNRTVDLVVEREIPNNELQSALLDQKYRIKDGTTVSRKLGEAGPKPLELAGLFALAIGFAWLIGRLGGLSGVTPGGAVSPAAALVLGFVASFSSCLAVVSGLLIASVASTSSKASNWSSKLAPLVSFLSGRLLAYSFLGGVLGWVGAKMTISPWVTIGLLVLASVYMVVSGLDLLHLLPASVKKWLPRAPKGLAHGAVDRASAMGLFMPLLLGAATFFLPCGFTQALQAYALTTGGFGSGALVLGAFALGSLPGLFVLGLAASWGKGKFGLFAAKFAGALVVVLGVLSLRSGWVLASVATEGLGVGNGGPKVVNSLSKDSNIKEQIIKMDVTSNGYEPSSLKVKAGIPVRWEITGKPGAGCAMGILSSSLGIEKYLNPGFNVISFYPPEPGRYSFACPMGMYRGSVTVE